MLRYEPLHSLAKDMLLAFVVILNNYIRRPNCFVLMDSDDVTVEVGGLGAEVFGCVWLVVEGRCDIVAVGLTENRL